MLVPDKSQVQLTSLLPENGFHNVVEVPTGLTCHASTFIDLFVTDFDSTYIKFGTLLPDESDPLPIFAFSAPFGRLAPKLNMIAKI